jgi:hypothetical protein
MEYSENTLTRYGVALRMLAKAGFTNFDEDPIKVVDYLNDKYDKFNTRKSYLSAIMSSYKSKSEIPEIYKEAIKKEFNLMKAKEEAQELTPEQDANYLDWEVLLGVQKDLKNIEDKSEAQELAYLVVSLYTLTSPVRADYGRMEVVKKYKKTGNIFVNSGQPYFVFREYKTAKTYGETKVKCPVALKNVIRRYFDILGEVPEFLLGKEYDPIVLSNYVRDVFRRYTGKSVGVNLIRHAYITYLNDEGRLRTTKQKEEVAHDMLHSTAQQQKYDLPESDSDSDYDSED